MSDERAIEGQIPEESITVRPNGTGVPLSDNVKSDEDDRDELDAPHDHAWHLLVVWDTKADKMAAEVTGEPLKRLRWVRSAWVNKQLEVNPFTGQAPEDEPTEGQPDAREAEKVRLRGEWNAQFRATITEAGASWAEVDIERQAFIRRLKMDGTYTVVDSGWKDWQVAQRQELLKIRIAKLEKIDKRTAQQQQQLDQLRGELSGKFRPEVTKIWSEVARRVGEIPLKKLLRTHVGRPSQDDDVQRAVDKALEHFAVHGNYQDRLTPADIASDNGMSGRQKRKVVAIFRELKTPPTGCRVQSNETGKRVWVEKTTHAQDDF